MKQVQIPEMLFIALVKYHLCDMPSEATAIKKGLENCRFVKHMLHRCQIIL
jgi:hypothetical protein